MSLRIAVLCFFGYGSLVFAGGTTFAVTSHYGASNGDLLHSVTNDGTNGSVATGMSLHVPASGGELSLFSTSTDGAGQRRPGFALNVQEDAAADTAGWVSTDATLSGGGSASTTCPDMATTCIVTAYGGATNPCSSSDQCYVYAQAFSGTPDCGAEATDGDPSIYWNYYGAVTSEGGTVTSGPPGPGTGCFVVFRKTSGSFDKRARPFDSVSGF